MTRDSVTGRNKTSDKTATLDAERTADRVRAGGLGRGLTSLLEEGETPDFGRLFQTGEEETALITPRR